MDGFRRYILHDIEMTIAGEVFSSILADFEGNARQQPKRRCSVLAEDAD